MLQVVNRTWMETSAGVLLNAHASNVWVVVIKGTWKILPDGDLEPDEEPEPVCLAPKYRGDPATSSLLRESELVVDHPGTDVTLNATAYAPHGRPVERLEVVVKVGKLVHRLRVVGDRYWTRGLVGWKPSAPKPYVTLPICWERAYGGTDERVANAVHPSNPIGVGFLAKPPEQGMPLPNLEPLGATQRRWNDRIEPVGFGAVRVGWSPRRERAGTYDQRWMRSRMPLWPDDYDPRVHLSAPEPLTSSRPLRGGERVELTNLTPEGRLSFRLPRLNPIVETELEDRRGRIRQPVQLDRVVIEPTERRVLLVWRSWLDVGVDPQRVRRSIVWMKRKLESGVV